MRRDVVAIGGFGCSRVLRCASVGIAWLVVMAASPADARAPAPSASPPEPNDASADATAPRDVTPVEPTPSEPPPSETAPSETTPRSKLPGATTTPEPTPVEPMPPEPTPSTTPVEPTPPASATNEGRAHAIEAVEPEAEVVEVRERPRTIRARVRTPKLAAYLTRELGSSARFLDHGTLEVSAAGGYPHRYRLGLALGLLDHLTLGLTVHWLPDQPRPRIAPRAALAFYRWRWIEVGATYDRSLYPPPPVDDDPETWSFQRDAHWIMAAASFSQSWISAGFEIGVVRARVADPGQPPTDDDLNPAVWRNKLGGGVMVRMGTRRWGFTFTGRAPWVFAEAAFDVRFGAFELRRRGGWRPEGIVRATDRRAPTRR
jgi:hypothetical protein